MCKYAKEMRSKKVDVVRDVILLPGLVKLDEMCTSQIAVLYRRSSLYSMIKCNEVGGQSIIFKRKNGPKDPYAKGFDANSPWIDTNNRRRQ